LRNLSKFLVEFSCLEFCSGNFLGGGLIFPPPFRSHCRGGGFFFGGGEDYNGISIAENFDRWFLDALERYFTYISTSFKEKLQPQKGILKSPNVVRSKYFF
jgi:hypothetical protein